MKMFVNGNILQCNSPATPGGPGGPSIIPVGNWSLFNVVVYPLSPLSPWPPLGPSTPIGPISPMLPFSPVNPFQMLIH